MSAQPETSAELFDRLVRDAAGPVPSSSLLRTSEVAALFRVSERAVTEWAKQGRLASLRTPGGHRRYPIEEVRARFLEMNPHLADGLS